MCLLSNSRLWFPSTFKFSIDEIKENLLEAQLSKERIAVEHHLKNGLITRLLLLYLMNSISDKFSTVQMEYFSKALVQQMMIARLLSILNEVQTDIGGVVKNEIMKHTFSELTREIIQGSLISELQELSGCLLDSVDQQEQEKLVAIYESEGRSHRLAYAHFTLPEGFREGMSRNYSGSGASDDKVTKT